MVQLVLALGLVFGAYWLMRKSANTTPAQFKGLSRKLAGGGLIALAGFLVLRGGINAAVPLFVAGLGLLGQQAMFSKGFPWARKTPGQTSHVATSLLAMELDHDTGNLDGEVLSGPLKGRKLSSLCDAELRSLHLLSANTADQSRTLLEAWLDRMKSGWRETWQPAASTQSREEAYAILGLKPGASANDIRAAHRKLMKEYHPDRGGSDYFAAKINQAKDILLQD